MHNDGDEKEKYVSIEQKEIVKRAETAVKKLKTTGWIFEVFFRNGHWQYFLHNNHLRISEIRLNETPGLAYYRCEIKFGMKANTEFLNIPDQLEVDPNMAVKNTLRYARNTLEECSQLVREITIQILEKTGT